MQAGIHRQLRGRLRNGGDLRVADPVLSVPDRRGALGDDRSASLVAGGGNRVAVLPHW